MSPRRSRRGFVKSDRTAWRELRGRLPGAVYRTLHALVIEADHRTGFVRGSLREVAGEFGDRWGTFHDHVLKLEAEGEIKVVEATNQWDDEAGIYIVRWAELQGETGG